MCDFFFLFFNFVFENDKARLETLNFLYGIERRYHYKVKKLVVKKFTKGLDKESYIKKLGYQNSVSYSVVTVWLQNKSFLFLVMDSFMFKAKSFSFF